MKINTKKFFELAKEKGLEACDLSFSHSKETNVSLFHNEVDSLSQSDTYSLLARGVYNGKMGTVSTEKFDKNTPQFLVDSIIENAKNVETNNPTIIYKGSKKYSRKNVFNKEVLSEDIKDKIAVLREIEKKIRAFDKRINEVATLGYVEHFDESFINNSYGLKLKDKSAIYEYYAEITVQEGEEIKSGFKIFASLDPKEFSIDKFVKDVAENALKKLGSTQCKSKKYPTIIESEPLSSLLKSYLSNMNAEEVQKKSSLFVDKLNQSIASKKLTVTEDPLQKNIFFKYHDDEGVATSKKVIVDKGVLKTYLYTLETAAKDNVEPTGNGVVGAKTVAGLNCLYVKPGRKSFDEIASTIKEGVYITSIEGLHAGMNAKSGNFSLQAQGFMIRDGKVAEPLSLITVAGNLSEMFNSIKEVANEVKMQLNGVYTPDIFFKSVAISGK